MKRKCGECPAETVKVCRHAFGKYWNDKSTNGEGCDFPLDGLAEAWRAAGWTPPGGGAAPAVPRAPRRPKVSAKILRQAELFFKGAK